MPDYDVIIVGAGPAGCTAAALLAERGAKVLLLEEKRMPREKLCGEFITPECFPTLERLGVMQEMFDAGAQRILDLRLVEVGGGDIQMPIAEISDSDWAMSLSRARFDLVLFERARRAGATCLEGMAVKGPLLVDGKPHGVEALSLADGEQQVFEAPIVIDASGRGSRFMIARAERPVGRRGSRLYAIKGHLGGVDGVDGRVSLYFFPGGYGGLVRVEEGMANLCFIAGERSFSAAGGDPGSVVESTITLNPEARERLSGAELIGKWHAVGPLSFGRRRLARRGIIAIGDASGMIDPFTGTGIQVALRTGELAAAAVERTLDEGSAINGASERALARYSESYEHELGSRMRAAGALRRIAFSPVAASLFAKVLNRSPRLTRTVLRSTRSGAA